MNVTIEQRHTDTGSVVGLSLILPALVLAVLTPIADDAGGILAAYLVAGVAFVAAGGGAIVAALAGRAGSIWPAVLLGSIGCAASIVWMIALAITG